MFKQLIHWHWKRKFRKNFGVILRKRYGKQNQYSMPQVKKTIEVLNWKLPEDCIKYGLAIYCIESEFLKYFNKSTYGQSSYNQLRQEIYPNYDDNPEFTANDVISSEASSTFTSFGDNYGESDSFSSDSCGTGGFD